MNQESEQAGLSRWVWGVSLATVAVHLVFNGMYGIFIDELYYIACAEHLSWGYVDQPPLSIFILWLWRGIVGDSLYWMRIPAILAMGAGVFLTGVLAREMGGRKHAQLIAALCAAIAPVYLGFGSYFSMNAFDLLFWVLAFYVLARLINSGDPMWWIAFGVVAGFGLQNKVSVGFLGVALVVGLILTRHRRHFLKPQLYVGGAIAVIIALPYVIWQFTHDFATLEFMRNASEFKNMPTNPVKFMGEQVLLMHPLGLPVWLSGLFLLFFWKPLRPYAIFGVMWLFLYFFFSLNQGKAYYLASAFPPLLAAGAMGLERIGQSWKGAWPVWAYGGLLLVTGLAILPMGRPALPPEQFMSYQQALGLAPPPAERGMVGMEMPQHLADRFGWEDLAKEAAKVYEELDEEEREDVLIVGESYASAGAVNVFGDRYGMPEAYSGHNSYWFWKPEMREYKAYIFIGHDRDWLNERFEKVGRGGSVRNKYSRAGDTIYVARGLKISMEEFWREMKDFI